MKLVIGCPVYRREWIMEEWLYFVRAACRQIDVTPTLVFVAEVGDPTRDLIREFTSYDVAIIDQPPQPEILERTWNTERYGQMAALRNLLLQHVRALDPDYFLSLDSDILLHPEGLRALLEVLRPEDRWGAVGGKCFMQPSGVECPSWANLQPSGGLRRADSEGTFTVDVIMALKLMSRPAYHVDYETHVHGEDIGWSIAARRAGVALGWVGTPCSKHVMFEQQLHEIDTRCGY